MARGKRGRRRIREGDGSPLKPLRWWQLAYRSLFSLEIPAEDGSTHTYTVDIDYLDWDGRLYRDGIQHAVATLPATFPVEGGGIEVALSTFGTRRVHYVLTSGEEHQLQPHPKSAEGRRASFDRRHPLASRLIGWAAIAILILGLVVLAPQLLEVITRMDWVAENIGTFTSPIQLNPALNTALTAASVAAGIERALMFRNHWLLDADTWWLDL
ncbi:MAG: hypothetical protein Q4G64_00335 [bacterium]|nr:hypothetical protein [bacterium]